MIINLLDTLKIHPIHIKLSVQQAAYFFTNVTIDENQIDADDWVGAFNGDICVGASQWDTSACGSGVCSINIMGNDGSEDTPGYCNPGDIPNFKIYDASENIYYDATPSENIAWTFNGFNPIDNLAANSDDSGEAITDGCDLPDSETTGYLHLTSEGSVLYKSLYAIGGFQFDVDGATVNDGSGGDMATYGLFGSAAGSTFLAFSFTGGTIPAGCGTLVNLDLNGDATGLYNIVVSDATGSQLYFEYYDGGDDVLHHRGGAMMG